MSRSRLLAILALAGALFVGGCGSSSAGSSGGAAGGGGGAAKVGDTVKLSDLAAREHAALEKAGSVKISASSGADDLSGVIVYSGGTQAMKVTGTSSGETVEIIYVDGVMYLGGLGGLAGGKKYIKIDPNGDDPMSQMLAPLLDSMNVLDPVAAYKSIGDLEAKVTKVDGDLVTYEVEVSGDRAAKMAREMLGTDLPTPTDTATSSPMTMTQVVNGQDQITEVTVSGDGQGMTMTYSDYGAAGTSITAPPADEVGTLDLGSLMSPS